MRTRIRRSIAAALATCALAAATPAMRPAFQEGRPGFRWDANSAEHLMNRAGFGGTPEEIERAVRLGQEAFVAELLLVDEYVDEYGAEPFFTRVKRRRPQQPDMTDDMRRERKREIRAEDGDQLRDFLNWWVGEMVETRAPLRERMTLFLHGHFTSSMSDVRNSHEMIEQNRLLRSHAFGNLGQLMHAVARDPAMLEYLDNDSNRRGRPNENFARELLELFTLGIGNYSEQDIKEAARAFTGWSDADGTFEFNRKRHDYGEKTFLGVTANLDGDDIIDIILAQEACAEFLAGKLVTYFEGVPPSPERLARYARLLRDAEYELKPLLEALFLDPAFYRAGVRGKRIASPIDYLVGSARRLSVDPPARMIVLGAALLGERLLHPPNVKGWEAGQAWITTGSLMQRGNLAGVLLGELSLDDFVDPMVEPGMDTEEGDAGDNARDDPGRAPVNRFGKRALGDLAGLKEFRRTWRPRINLTGAVESARARNDREIVTALTDRLLAVDVDAATREALVPFLRDQREALEIPEGELLDQPWEAEPVLRRLAHLVLSLPEAQLH